MILHLIYNRGAEVRVHKAGCRDITAAVLKAATSEYKLARGTSQRMASDDFWADFISEGSVSSDDALENYTEFLPCTEGLPREEGETMTATTTTRATAKPATAKPATKTTPTRRTRKAPADAKPATKDPIEQAREDERAKAAELVKGVTREPATEPKPAPRTRAARTAKPATETAPKPATRSRKAPATKAAAKPAPATTRTRKAGQVLGTGPKAAKSTPLPKRTAKAPAPKAAANGSAPKSYAKQVLARRIIDLVAGEFAKATDEDKARISYWLHGLPTGSPDGDGAPVGGGLRYWPASLPKPQTADWR